MTLDSKLDPEKSIIGQAPVTWAGSVLAATAVLVGIASAVIDRQYQGTIESLRAQVAGAVEESARLRQRIDEDAAAMEVVWTAYQNMLAERAKALKEMLESDPAKVGIIGGGRLSDTISQIFESSGWATESITDLDPAGLWEQANSPASGIVLYESEGWDTIRDAFDEAGVPYTVERTSAPDDTPRVLVYDWAGLLPGILDPVGPSPE